jgi:hypothetical protein
MAIWKSVAKEYNGRQPTRTQFAHMLAKRFYKSCDPRAICVDTLRFTLRVANGSPIKLEGVYTEYMAAERHRRFPIIQRFVRDCVQAVSSDGGDGSARPGASVVTNNDE